MLMFWINSDKNIVNGNQCGKIIYVTSETYILRKQQIFFLFYSIEKCIESIRLTGSSHQSLPLVSEITNSSTEDQYNYIWTLTIVLTDFGRHRVRRVIEECHVPRFGVLCVGHRIEHQHRVLCTTDVHCAWRCPADLLLVVRRVSKVWRKE